MKNATRVLFLFLLVLLGAVQIINAQAGPSSSTWASPVGTGPLGSSVSFVNGPIPANFSISYVVTGTPSACTFKVEGSPDNNTWITIGTASTSCTSTGLITISSTPVNYLRINLLTYTSNGATVIFTQSNSVANIGGASAGVVSVNGATGAFVLNGANCTYSAGTETCTVASGSLPAGVSSDGSNGLVVTGNVQAASANISQVGPASTASSAVATPDNVVASVTPLNSSFLRSAHNQWALAGLQQGGVVNNAQYTIGSSFTITAWSASASTQLVSFTVSTASNVPAGGLPVLISGLTSGTQFNNQIGIVAQNPVPTTTSFSVVFPFTISTASATESGTAVLQAVQLHTESLEDSTAQFHSGEQLCMMGLEFPGVGISGQFTGGLSLGNGTNSWGGWPCATGGGGAITLTSACITDGQSACAPNGGTPLPNDYTHFPNGIGYKVYAGGSISAAAALSTQVIALFETDPSSGTYTVQTNTNSAGFVTAATGGPVAPTGSATGAVGTGIAYSTTAGASGQIAVQVTATGGPLYVYALAQNNTLKNGLFPSSEAEGGQSIATYGQFPQGILQPWHAALGIHILFYEQKSNGTQNPSGDCSQSSPLAPTTYIPFPTLLSNTFQSFTGAVGLSMMDILYIGSYDVASHCVPFQNDSARAYLASASPQGVYFDGYYESTNTQMQSLALNQYQNGNVHAAGNQQGSVGDALAQFIGYGNWPNSSVGQNIFANKIGAYQTFGMRDALQASPYSLLFTASSSNVLADVECDLIFRNLSGSAGIVCIGSNFTSCPSGAMQVQNGQVNIFGTIGSTNANFQFSGGAAQITATSTSSFQLFGPVININNSNQVGAVRYSINGTAYYDLGTNGNCGASAGTDFVLCAKQGTTGATIDLPNTMPNKSIGGNSKGATLLTIQTATNCAVNSASPAACSAAASGAVVVPTTTTTYTVNTTAVQAGSRIFVFPRTYAGDLPSSPTCVAPAVTSAPNVSTITAGTSFTFTLPSTSGQTCWNYEVIN